VAALLVALLFLVACESEGQTRYVVVVQFNERVTQEDMDAVEAYLRGYDTDVDFLIQESFPPTGVARFEAREKNVCGVIEVELPSFRGVESVTCAKESDGIPVDGDAPVSSTAVR
jgi:hypothetical protein